LKILAVHNFYQQKGGEDAIFFDETALMEGHGHTVIRHSVHNDAIRGMNKLVVARNTIYNEQSYRELRALIQQHRPDVVHFHNTFPLISPSGYDAAGDEGVAVIQNVQNYRFTCVGATLYRDDHVCEDCVGKTFGISGVAHRCYRGSLLGSLVVASLTASQRLKGTWSQKVGAFVVPNEFMRQKLTQAGLPEQKLRVKANFITPDPGAGDGSGGYAVFVGRLAREKGLLTMLDAWETLHREVPLKVVGDGPLRADVEARASKLKNVELMGHREPKDVLDIVGRAAALIFPSGWYEGQPKTIIESFARGTPIIGSHIGAMIELVREGQTGYSFVPGNSLMLAEAVRTYWGARDKWTTMRQQTRIFFEQHFTAERNYPQLLKIYEDAVAAL
jgi:glycosyltransferase involved in cell wall biosynthesis